MAISWILKLQNHKRAYNHCDHWELLQLNSCLFSVTDYNYKQYIDLAKSKGRALKTSCSKLD